MSLRTRGLLTLVLLAVGLVSAAAARAEVVLRQDAAGRAITFDVLAPTVDVDWYAAILSGAAHGNEISGVTIRIVPTSEIAGRCGAEAAACFEQRGDEHTITVSAGKSDGLASILLHEYGHHLDSTWAVDGVAELNGTPVWWAARGMAALLQAGSVTWDYSLGWDRSIGEVFAEDYAYVHRGGFYSIPWLAPPDEALKTSLLAELGGATEPPMALPAPQPAEPAARPVVVVRSGTLAPRGRRTIPFQLLGPGRHVTVTASVGTTRRSRTAARVEVICNNSIVRRMHVRDRRVATLDLTGLGPARCEAVVVSTSAARLRYSVRLRLALDGQS
ncbi:MAG: hypothetical protein ACRDNB_03120 [Gaiellaceae bacterium]